MKAILEFMGNHIPSLARLTDPVKRQEMLLWREEMKHRGYVMRNGEVQCSFCGSDCGQCGEGAHMERLRLKWIDINAS